jgi:formylglycine-generating enzyme required for sulfatase activity
MRKLVLFLFMTIIVTSGACARVPDQFVLVKGGDFVNTKSNLYEKGLTISDFYISKYEVSQQEWVEVMDTNPSEMIGDNLPVEMVSWYDCIEYCNRRSKKEGLEPYYKIDKDQKDPNNLNDSDEIKWTVTIMKKANGYRLPTEAEWEYAAGGGQESKSYTYSGSDDIDEVAWYWRNSGDEYLTGEWFWQTIEENNNRTQVIGTKKPNELGLYDMSGNVREWCWDWYTDVVDSASGAVRVWRGGGWLGDAKACEATYRGNYEAYSKGYDQGFRICLDK